MVIGLKRGVVRLAMTRNGKNLLLKRLSGFGVFSVRVATADSPRIFSTSAVRQ